MKRFSDRLLAWYDRHGRRDLPWQRSITPYRVWVSEIMLQQTQVGTVIPYYERFMHSFPDVAALAAAPVDEVLHHWSGLGYYARARNLHRAAQVIRDEYAGEFPQDFDAVVALPGIGRSTAGAILAIACGKRYPILDGNVKRVLARYHAIAGWPGRTATLNALWEAAESHTPASRTGDYTQAIMDLGATLCTRSRPRCDACPVQRDCAAHRLQREADFPAPRPKKNRPQRETVMPLVHAGRQVYLERKPPAGIWGGLWCPPEIESRAALDDWLAQRFGDGARQITAWTPLRHSFSHFDLDILPVEVRLERPSRRVESGNASLWYSLDRPPDVGLAAPIRTLIDQLDSQT